MGKAKKANSGRKPHLEVGEQNVSPLKGKTAEKVVKPVIETRSRAKRSNFEPASIVPPDQPPKKVVKVKNSSAKEAPKDTNNNATVGIKPIVGSAKSLIDAIKGRKVTLERTSSPVPCSSGFKGKSKETVSKSPKVPKRRKPGMIVPEDQFDRDLHDDEVSLNPPSDEDYDDQVETDSNAGSNSQSTSSDESSSDDDESVDYDNESNQGIDSQAQNDEDLDKQALRDLRQDPQVRKLLDIMLQEEKADRAKVTSFRGRADKTHPGRSRSKSRPKSHTRSRSRSRTRSRSRVHGKRYRSRSRSKSRRRYGRSSRKRSRSPSRERSYTPDHHHSKCKRKRIASNQSKLKSPSDVTLYMPALRKDKTVAASPTLAKLSNGLVVQEKAKTMSLIDELSDLVERVRMENSPRHCSRDRSASVHRDSQPRNDQDEGVRNRTEQNSRVHVRPEVAEGNLVADRMITEAERFKAAVQPPKGELDQNMGEFMRYIADNDDDSFFHLTCHVDPGLKTKIENGEFIDLDKLQPRTRTQIMGTDQSLQQYVNKNGTMYWAPPERESRITNIRRWEQSFRIYAAIYCKANPDRSAEIWQYVHVINTAAVSYAWENVYFYDSTFRQLMSERPNRSWSKIFTQLWNLAMCDHLPKNVNHNAFTPRSDRYAGPASNNNNGNVSWRDKCCWRYNRGNKCRKWSCRFDHRCSNCGAWSHGKNSCNKRGDNRDNHERRSRSRSPKRKQQKR